VTLTLFIEENRLIWQHRCAQAKILDRGHKDEKIKGVIKNSFRGGSKPPKTRKIHGVGEKKLYLLIVTLKNACSAIIKCFLRRERSSLKEKSGRRPEEIFFHVTREKFYYIKILPQPEIFQGGVLGF